MTTNCGKFLYIQTNDIREGQNAVLGYIRKDDGTLDPLPGNPFYTGGTGINNDTHGKLGPHDNDTPLIVSQDGKRLFTVYSRVPFVFASNQQISCPLFSTDPRNFISPSRLKR